MKTSSHRTTSPPVLVIWLVASLGGHCFCNPKGLSAQFAVANATDSKTAFSTKDLETDMIYYGYRYYNASTGRWLSRDPMQEDGGESLYAITLNDCVNTSDALGEKAIYLGFGYDTSVRASKRLNQTMNGELAFLYNMVVQCISQKLKCECDLGDAPAISAQYIGDAVSRPQPTEIIG